jgi:glyoxylase-like metal-dependent hydrolase (beta-lactamase superfamily II)
MARQPVTDLRIRSVLAPNPSMMTHQGTNSYILGSGRVAVIDPGPDLANHQSAILAALAPGESISHILITHSHLDHTGLANSLAKATGALVLAFGTAHAGRSDTMTRIAQQLPIGGGEGLDHAFHPDQLLADGETIAGDTWSLEAIHTPGHLGNHVCFAHGRILFSGDHVMGWSTSLISPPDGDMTDYMASLQKLSARTWDRFYPGHGAEVADPAGRLTDLLAHRKGREAALLTAMADGLSDLQHLTRRIYMDLNPALFPAAERNILAHLIDLEHRNLVRATPTVGPTAQFFRC